jgi:hypothetical protein
MIEDRRAADVDVVFLDGDGVERREPLPTVLDGAV